MDLRTIWFLVEKLGLRVCIMAARSIILAPVVVPNEFLQIGYNVVFIPGRYSFLKENVGHLTPSVCPMTAPLGPMIPYKAVLQPAM
jgi:hypothetical protein